MRHQPDSPGTSITTARGRPFVTGNPGRKPGPRNRTTIVAAALLEGDAEALTRKAIELALAGDVGMLKFLLGRILPGSGRCSLISLPYNSPMMQWRPSVRSSGPCPRANSARAKARNWPQ